jgi:hypothetical protein
MRREEEEGHRDLGDFLLIQTALNATKSIIIIVSPSLSSTKDIKYSKLESAASCLCWTCKYSQNIVSLLLVLCTNLVGWGQEILLVHLSGALCSSLRM